jgi:hypothetical protein
MKLSRTFAVLGGCLLFSVCACSSEDTPGSQQPGGGTATPAMSFFVTSGTSTTGNLGGLAGADKRCQDLAAAAGAGSKRWAAYLSAEAGPVHAKDRIGQGPWFNAKLVMVARNVADLHARTSRDAELFLDERGNKINGQWATSPTPNQHDILTGTNADGTVVMGGTCADWTSDAPNLRAQVGHSDGLGPMMNPNPPYASWNSSHLQPETNATRAGGCANTAPGGGAGRTYCFATN